MTSPAVTVDLEIGELKLMLDRAQEVCEDLMSLVDHQYQGDEPIMVRRRNRDKHTAAALIESVGIIKRGVSFLVGSRCAPGQKPGAFSLRHQSGGRYPSR